MKQRLKLIETLNDGELSFFNEDDNGIFYCYVNSYIHGGEYDADYPTPWLTVELAQDYDRNYYLNRSGQKRISRIYQSLIDKLQVEPYDTVLKEDLMKIIVSKFGDKWNRLHDAFVMSSYEPLENYDMEQTETPDVTKTRNVNSSIQTDNDIYGFNSGGTSVPSSKSTTHGASTDNESVETETGTRGLTRHGNIGVTTSQQMLQSEIDLRNNFNFMNQIMDDVDSILCLLVY